MVVQLQLVLDKYPVRGHEDTYIDIPHSQAVDVDADLHGQNKMCGNSIRNQMLAGRCPQSEIAPRPSRMPLIPDLPGYLIPSGSDHAQWLKNAVSELCQLTNKFDHLAPSL
jgi:hypothetical protein